jgi:TetR/AcrR family transcriptional regulator, transcriptional repressor for nem operon
MARPKEFEEVDVLEKAMYLFWQKGYYQASIQDLVDTMGINRASLYGAFADKHNLYMKALERYRQQDVSEILLLFNRNLPAKQFFEALFDNIIVGLTDDPDHKGCFITNATLEMLPDDQEVQALVSTNISFLQEIFIEILNNSLEMNELNNKILPVETANFLISQIYGLRMIGKAMPNLKVLNGIKNEVLGRVF